MPNDITAPPPAGPHGLYDFGFPSELVDIHFPTASASDSKPWYWFVKRQQPNYFQYLGSQAGGHGWQCTANFPLIKILPIDTQPLTPTPFVGFNTINEAIDHGSPDGTFGRFRFTNRDFWNVIGSQKPEFTSKLGIPTQTTNTRKPPLGPLIKAATTLWDDDWNATARSFSGVCSGVSGDGSYGLAKSFFAIQPPPPNSTIPFIQEHGDDFYFGPIPATYIFETGQALFWKQAYGFTFGIGQLDDKLYDMSVFPPQKTDFVTREFASAKTHDYGGYGLSDFPINFTIV